MKPLLNTFLKHGWADLLAMEAVVTASDVDWTAFLLDAVAEPTLIRAKVSIAHG